MIARYGKRGQQLLEQGVAEVSHDSFPVTVPCFDFRHGWRIGLRKCDTVAYVPGHVATRNLLLHSSRELVADVVKIKRAATNEFDADGNLCAQIRMAARGNLHRGSCVLASQLGTQWK